MSKFKFYHQALEKKFQQKNYIQLKSLLPEDLPTNEEKKPLLNFISNDFLGISDHPYVKKNSIKYVLKWGAGSSPSKLISNHLECQNALEEKLAKLFGKDVGQFFQTSSQLHTMILGTFLNKTCEVYIDESCHPGLFKAVSSTQAKLFRFEHNCPEHLAALLREQSAPNNVRWVILESVYAQEGDLAKLKEILEVCHPYHCLIYLDESNAFSILGHHGLGFGALKKEIDCITGYFQRGSGSHSGFVVTKSILKNYLTQFNPDISPYSLLPPATLGAIEAYLELIPDMHAERQKVMHLSRFLRQSLQEDGFQIGKSATHWIVIHFSDADNFQSFAHHLVEENVLAYISKSDYTIRFVITAAHTKEMLTDLLSRVKIWIKPLVSQII
jgi:8-amino-7-oxononanoate synthase